MSRQDWIELIAVTIVVVVVTFVMLWAYHHTATPGPTR